MSARRKAKVAQKHGAIGAVAFATLQFEKAFPWEKVLEYSNDPDSTGSTPTARRTRRRP